MGFHACRGNRGKYQALKYHCILGWPLRVGQVDPGSRVGRVLLRVPGVSDPGGNVGGGIQRQMGLLRLHFDHHNRHDPHPTRCSGPLDLTGGVAGYCGNWVGKYTCARDRRAWPGLVTLADFAYCFTGSRFKSLLSSSSKLRLFVNGHSVCWQICS